MARETSNQVDALFGLPLEEFTAERNRLAAELKRGGDAPAADEVRRLAKPTLPAWSINQLARRHADSVAALLDAGEVLRRVNAEALQGTGGMEAIQEAKARERKAVDELVRRARELLSGESRTPTRQVLDRIASSLQAAAVTEEGREALRAGRLSSEPEPAALETLMRLPAGAPRRGSRAGAAKPKEQRRDRERERGRLRKLRDRARSLDEEARVAEREADRAERTAAQARKAAERARAAADDAAAELDRPR